MWQMISNISAVVTCFLFVLYIIGHVWKISNSKHLLYEKFQIEQLAEEEIHMLDNLVELDEEEGEIFSICSPNGMKNISVYEATYDGNKNRFVKGKLLHSLQNINVDEKVYFRTAIPCGIPNKYIELEKCDYVKIKFAVAQSGKNGEFIKSNHECKMTLKSWIYYMCS